jgi:hypothetical protein
MNGCNNCEYAYQIGSNEYCREFFIRIADEPYAGRFCTSWRKKQCSISKDDAMFAVIDLSA